MINLESAEKITMLFVLLALGQDPADDVNAFEKKLKSARHVEIFAD